jgi:hypothetical protein
MVNREDIEGVTFIDLFCNPHLSIKRVFSLWSSGHARSEIGRFQGALIWPRQDWLASDQIIKSCSSVAMVLILFISM